jgi:hypothetical protein
MALLGHASICLGQGGARTFDLCNETSGKRNCYFGGFDGDCRCRGLVTPRWWCGGVAQRRTCELTLAEHETLTFLIVIRAEEGLSNATV